MKKCLFIFDIYIYIKENYHKKFNHTNVILFLVYILN